MILSFNTELFLIVCVSGQDGSLRLYLCAMLRRRPVLTLGTVSSVGGDRYLMVYLPDYGQEVGWGVR